MPQHDQLHRYLFENFAVRGELVTVSETLQQILENHDYPQPVKNVLAELLVATSLLTATLKFDGDITVQLQGDGPMNLAVINGNNNQQMRGVARVQGEIRCLPLAFSASRNGMVSSRSTARGPISVVIAQISRPSCSLQ